MPPTAPTNLVVTATTEHSVSLAWGSSTDNSGRFSYVICCAGTTVTVSQTTTSHTLAGLQSGKTYTFRVYAKDVAGNLSKATNPVTVTVPGKLAAPTKPVVSVLDVGPTHASLHWSSTDDSPTILYTIYIDGEPVSTTNSKSGAFTCAAVPVPTGCAPLDSETTYTFTVRARDVDGNVSAVSDPFFVDDDPADPDDHTPPYRADERDGRKRWWAHHREWDSLDRRSPRSRSSVTTCTSTASCARSWLARRPLKSRATSVSTTSQSSQSTRRTTNLRPARRR